MSLPSPETASAAPPGPTFSLRLFGPFAAAVQGRPVTKVRSQKELWLLALLVLRAPAPLERRWLAAILWPEADHEDALYNLRRTLRLLRQALGPEAARLGTPTPRTLCLDLAGADCDVAAFDHAVRRGDPASLAEAAARYGGPLLLGCAEEWALPERDAREASVLDILEKLAAGAQARGDWADAAAHLRRALEIDPLRETALRALLRALSAQGCHPAAAEAYHAFRRRVRDELNLDVDPETVAVYRRVQADGRREAPPAPAPSRHTDRLPTPLTTLIGRAGEIQDVGEALERSRLVTLIGPGGVGKTRLAVAAARSRHAEFGSGVWFAELAPLADSKLLMVALIHTLGLREAPGRTPTEVVVEFLRERHLLLVLDNCEHLTDACARLALGLLRECPALHLLATSREPLRVPGEAVLPVRGLPVEDGARLFVERATQSNPGFHLHSGGEESVSGICRRLDGLPLAIEMAAARTRALPLSQIAVRLGDAFRLLSEPGGDLLPRHQTLRATLDWSYDLLPAAEKTLLSRLSVFAGGWTLEAAEAVCVDAPGAVADPITPEIVLDLLTALADKSLVVYAEQSDGTARFRLLEMVRQYAAERLSGSGAATLVRGQAAAWFLGVVEVAALRLSGPEQPVWLSRLETEHDNLRAALAWFEGGSEGGDDPKTAERGLRLAAILWRFWYVRGHLSEGRQWLERLLGRPGAEKPTAARGEALNSAGVLAWRQGDRTAAQSFHEESLSIKRLLGDQRGIANSLGNLGTLAIGAKDFAKGRALHEESLALDRQTGNLPGVAATLNNLGNLMARQGEYAEARAFHEEGLSVKRQLGDPRSIANSLANLGKLMRLQRDYPGARRSYGESLPIQREIGDQVGIAIGLEGMAALAGEQGHLSRAVQLCQAAASLRERLGTPALPSEQQEFEEQVNAFRAALGAKAFAAAWETGKTMTWEQAVEYALSDEGSRRRHG